MSPGASLLLGVFVGFGAASQSVAAGAPVPLALAGEWHCQLDRQDAGIAEKWFDRQLRGSAKLPGSLAENGLGDDVTIDTPWTGQIVDRSFFTDPEYAPYRKPGSVKVPFWLTPVKHYVGPAWFQREVTIPDSWKGKHAWLFLERVHWESRVWVDGREAGMRNSLSTPHEYALGELPPGKHRLTVRVDNRVKIDVGVNAHSVTDHTQTNWNGIVGRMELVPRGPVWIDDVQVFPDVAECSATVRVRVGCALEKAGDWRLTAVIQRDGQTVRRHAGLPYHSADRGVLEEKLTFGDGALADAWDEFSPRRYDLTVELKGQAGGAEFADRRTVSFGMREVGVRGTQITVNGRPVFLRGTLECAIFPKTGYPPTDVEEWTRILKVARAHGLNHLRFHSWCPPEAAFVAADRMGFMYQVECAVWTTVGTNPEIDAYLQAESERIVRAYGNHPSFCLLSHGNEPSGGAKANQFLAQWVNRWKQADPRRMYTAGSGWPALPESQYHVTPAPRIQAWGGGLASRVNARPPETTTDYRDFVAKSPAQPLVSHEIGQWCVYPNFDEIEKYTGVTRAYNFEVFRDTLRANHMLDQARDFLMASGKLQAMLYKEEIESALRTPGFGGFELLDLHDFPGQGTALVGVLDPFWDSKGYITPEEFHRFACETVPLARMEKRTWTTGEAFKAAIEIAHFGPAPIEGARPVWKITGQDGRVVASGNLASKAILLGGPTALGEVLVPLAKVAVPQKLVLAVSLEGTPYANDWDFWVYPVAAKTEPSEDVLIVDRLSDKAIETLKAGGKVLLLPAPGTVKGDKHGRIPPGFSSIFWNTAWTRRQAPHTLGILCDPEHPALAAFPTEFHSNWQWWDLVAHSQIMILNDMPPELRPVVQVIDDWFTNRRLGLVFEAKVGGGKLLVSGIDLRRDLAGRPVARQMLASLLGYMAGPGFAPRHEVPVERVRGLFAPPPAKASSDSPGNEAAKTIDGDPAASWHIRWEPDSPPPHEIQIDLRQALALAGLRYLPR